MARFGYEQLLAPARPSTVGELASSIEHKPIVEQRPGGIGEPVLLRLITIVVAPLMILGLSTFGNVDRMLITGVATVWVVLFSLAPNIQDLWCDWRKSLIIRDWLADSHEEAMATIEKERDIGILQAQAKLAQVEHNSTLVQEHMREVKVGGAEPVHIPDTLESYVMDRLLEAYCQVDEVGRVRSNVLTRTRLKEAIEQGVQLVQDQHAEIGKWLTDPGSRRGIADLPAVATYNGKFWVLNLSVYPNPQLAFEALLGRKWKA